MTLLLRPSIEMGEGPQGYLYRLAEANGIGLAALSDLGVHYDVEQLGRLGYVPDGFSNTAIGQCAKAIGSSIDDEVCAWNRDVPRYCAQCLEEASFWRFEWEIVFSDACPKHGVWLRDRCSFCGQMLTWQRTELLRCECGAALRGQRHQACPQAVSGLAATLRAAVWPDDAGSTLPLLDGLSLSQVQRLVRFLAAYGTTSSGRFPQKVAAVTHLDVSWQMTSLAAEIIDQWPDSFFRVLDQMQSVEPTSGKLSSRFGHCYTVLYRGFPEQRFDFLRRTFENYIAEHWRGAYGGRNRRLAARLPAQLAWVPAKHARQLLRVSQRRLDDLVRQHRIASEERTGKSGRRFLVLKRSDVQVEARKREAELDLASAASLLGLTKRRLSALLPYLIPEACKTGHAGCPWAVPRERVDGLLNVVAAIPILDAPTEEQISLAHILQYWPWSDKTIADCLRAILAGRVMPNGRLAVGAVCGLVFDRHSLETWYAATQQVCLDSMSVPDVALRLRVKQEVIYFLVRRGFIASFTVPKGRRKEQRISSEGIRSFGERFIFGRDIAASFATSPRHLAEKLSQLGVEPCSGPGADACRQLLYEKSENLSRALQTINAGDIHARRARSKYNALLPIGSFN